MSRHRFICYGNLSYIVLPTNEKGNQPPFTLGYEIFSFIKGCPLPTMAYRYRHEECDADRFQTLGLEIAGQRLRDERASKRYKAHFGCSPAVTAAVWSRMRVEGQKPAIKPFHLLWTLVFLKGYYTESVASGICRCNETTYRTRVWQVLKLVDELNEVSRRLRVCCVTFWAVLGRRLTFSLC
jgi:hypothetical protein